MGFYRLGSPPQRELEDLVQVVLCRFRSNPEGAVEYITGTIDRQIAKASSLLTYNSILFAGLQIRPSNTWPSTCALWLSLISCALVLALLFVEWRSAASYRDPKVDFCALVRLAARRSRLLTCSLVLSLLGTFAAMTSLVWTGKSP